jgi:methyl-accepting chemotaxis protein
MTLQAATFESLPLQTLPGIRLAAVRLALGSAGLAGVALAWLGGAAGLLGALLVGASSVALLLQRRAVLAASVDPAVAAGSGTPDSDRGGRTGPSVMVAQVVPVWQRQLLATCDTADQGLSALLEAFNGFSGALDELARQFGSASVGATPGAIDLALQSEAPALAALLSPSQRAFAQRDAAVAELTHCVEALAQLQPLVKQAREVARHTRLVAFNAAIEAQRSGAGQGGGTQAVANEIRMLAARMADTAEQADRAVTALHGRIKAHAMPAEIGDTSADELKLETELRAREALTAMLAALGTSLQGTASVQQASGELRRQIDEAYVQFQFGDRLSQMMAILANDMQQLVRWVAAHPSATQSDAAEWLLALENSYTMDEQRSQHHGNVSIDRASEVEFF